MLKVYGQYRSRAFRVARNSRAARVSVVMSRHVRSTLQPPFMALHPTATPRSRLVPRSFRLSAAGETSHRSLQEVPSP
jgi:hypothetical protein